MAVASLFALVTFLLPLLASMAGSQTIAGEAEAGTLRTVLMQPVRRGTLLIAKWFVANLYIAIGLVILAIGSLIAGGAIYGLKPLTLLTGQSVSVGESIWLIFLAYVFVLVGMATVVSLAVAFSTLTNSSLTAVGAALVLVIIMLVLGSLSVFDFLQPYLFTSSLRCLGQLLPGSHRLGSDRRRAHQLRCLDRGDDGYRLRHLPPQRHTFLALSRAAARFSSSPVMPTKRVRNQRAIRIHT